jgi:hypothetical protein
MSKLRLWMWLALMVAVGVGFSSLRPSPRAAQRIEVKPEVGIEPFPEHERDK